MKGQGLLLALVSAVVAVAIVAGFVVMGSPHAARMSELDKKRVNDLRGLAMTLCSGKDLPENLRAWDWGLRLKTDWDTTDPVTHQPYGYRKLDADHFELCAVFQTAVSPADMDSWERPWAHPAGAYCFDFDKKAGGTPGGRP